MANKTVIDNARAKLQHVLIEAENLKNLNHGLLRGRFRELLINKFFKDYLPEDFDIGTGKIIDHCGSQSREVDAILYNSRITPQILYGEKDGFFPVESSFYIFEIKSRVTLKEVRDSILKGQSIQNLSFMTSTGSDHQPVLAPLLPIRRILFGLKSDSKGNELERYLKEDKNGLINPAIDVICVVGKGYYFFDYDQKIWRWFQPCKQINEEPIQLLAGVLNSLPDMLRGRSVPHFGHYLIDTEDYKNDN